MLQSRTRPRPHAPIVNRSTLRIATRKSPLALWQAEYVAVALRAMQPEIAVQLYPLSTQGDQLLDAPLAKVGGKGLFVKELEHALLSGAADLAVHSMKDVPVDLPAGLHIAALLPREDPRDALVSSRWSCLDELPQGARVGTSSLRRQSQLRAQRADLCIEVLRGNVQTRLEKLQRDGLDAIVLAAAGLKRLGLEQHLTAYLAPEASLPAIGQGAIGVECRADDQLLNGWLAALHDHLTGVCVTAERAFNRRLNGGCQAPLAGYAVLEAGDLWLRGLVATVDGTQIVRGEARGRTEHAAELGYGLADELLARGADRVLAELYAGEWLPG